MWIWREVEGGFWECGSLLPRCSGDSKSHSFAPGGCYHPPRPDSLLSRMITSSTSRRKCRGNRDADFRAEKEGWSCGSTLLTALRNSKGSSTPTWSMVNVGAQCLQSDDLAAPVAGGYHEDGSFQLLGHEVQVAFRLVRQLLIVRYALGDLLPAGKLPVDRFAVL